MKIELEIEDRLYKDFNLWAKANNIPEDGLNKYIIQAFREKFNLDKYGDLNEKLKQKPSEPEKPKRTTVRKTKSDIEKPVPEPEPESQQEEPAPEEKPKRRTKVLASK